MRRRFRAERFAYNIMPGWFSRHVFMGPAQRRMLLGGRPIFTYHKIDRPPPGTRDPFLYVSPEGFAEQLAAMRRAGYASGSLDEFGAQPTEKTAVITFDDGFCDVLDNGLEVLARHNFSAIQFIVAGFLGRKNEWDIAKGDTAEPLMDEAQIREWLAAGHAIGSHSMTHRNLRHLSGAEAREEISGSKKILEDRLGVAIHHFCYPYGSWNEKVRDFAIQAGYRTGCTVRFGVNPASTPPFELRRIIPLSGTELLRKICHRLQRKLRRK